MSSDERSPLGNTATGLRSRGASATARRSPTRNLSEMDHRTLRLAEIGDPAARTEVGLRNRSVAFGSDTKDASNEDPVAAAALREQKARRQQQRAATGQPPSTPASPASPSSMANLEIELGPALGGAGREEGEPKRLYTFDELPLHLRDNPFILTNYRAYLSSAECIQSVFEIHNETGNIWTHLLGFFFFLGLGLWVLIDVVPRGASAWNYAIFVILTLGCMGCMACSTTFHTMAAHMSLERFKRFHAMDYLGITLLIVASFVPCCYYVFVCQPYLQWGYLAMICTIGSAGIITPLMPFFEEEYFFWPRLGIYVSIVCSGLAPAAHTFLGTPVNATTQYMYIGVLLMFLLYGTGVVIYASNFPERFAPGRFDVWLMSHQIWHYFVLMAAIVHYFTCVALYQNWQVMMGKC